MKRSLTMQLMVFLSIFIIIVFSILGTVMYQIQKNILINQETQIAKQTALFVYSLIDSKSEEATLGAYIIANTPEYQILFEEKKREELYQKLQNIWKVLSTQFGVKQLQFHIPPAISFLRVHKPDKFGDDLSSFRKTVVKCNTEKKAVKGIEKGKAGFGIRGVVPVFGTNGKHIGSVELGLSLDKNLLYFLKSKLGGEWFFYSLSEGVSWENKKFFGTIDNDPYQVPETYIKQVKSGTVTIYLDKIHNSGVVLIPIRDFSSNIVGYIKVSKPTQYFATLSNTTQSIIITSVVMAIAIFLLVMSIFLRLNRAINTLQTAANSVASGNLKQDIPDAPFNEIKPIANSLKTLRSTLLNILKLMSETSSHITNLSLNLSQFSQDHIQQANQLQEFANKLNTTTYEIANGMNHIQEQTNFLNEQANALYDMSTNLQKLSYDVTNAIKKGKEAVYSLESFQNVKEDSKLMTQSIEEIVKQTGDIETILNTIRGISDQTHLLALNAAIEAARAGDNGRGFAVVADEIRKLAEESKQSTQQITEILQALINRSLNAQKFTNQMIQSINKVEPSIAAVSNSFSEIALAISEVNKGINTLTEHANQQKEITTDISNKISMFVNMLNQISNETQSLNTITREINQSASTLVLYSQELSDIAQKFSSFIRKFKI